MSEEDGTTTESGSRARTLNDRAPGLHRTWGFVVCGSDTHCHGREGKGSSKTGSHRTVRGTSLLSGMTDL